MNYAKAKGLDHLGYFNQNNESDHPLFIENPIWFCHQNPDSYDKIDLNMSEFAQFTQKRTTKIEHRTIYSIFDKIKLSLI